MKKSELSFKCVLADDAVEIYLKQKLGVGDERSNGNRFARFYNGCLTTTSSTLYFCAWPEPIMNYQDALKLIANVEPDAPEFDIKLRDEVLTRDNDNDPWEIAVFARLAADLSYPFISFADHFKQIIKFAGNEQYHGATDIPDGWWECENGKPVWKMK